MKLTETKIKKLQFDGKKFKITDGYGLYLLVSKKSKRFYCRYTYRKQQFDVPIGEYPFISLEEARSKVFTIRHNLAHGLPPLPVKVSDPVFGEICEEFLNDISQKIAPRTLQAILSRYNLYIKHSKLSTIRISEITPQDILNLLSPLRKDGKEITAKNVRQFIGRVFRYGIEHYNVQNDPTYALALMRSATPYKTEHYPTISRSNLGQLLRRFDDLDISATNDALRLLPLLFVRQTELRCARVEEFDLSANLWRIPANRVKQRREHIVPLSKQAVEIIKRRIASAKNGLLFPSSYGQNNCISRTWLSKQLKLLCDFDVCLHSFRSTASTLLHELGFHSDLIELQLSHKVKNQVVASYHFASFLDERMKMMQVWADFLDELRLDNSVS